MHNEILFEFCALYIARLNDPVRSRYWQDEADWQTKRHKEVLAKLVFDIVIFLILPANSVYLIVSPLSKYNQYVGEFYVQRF